MNTQYGQFYFGVVLADGTEVFAMADRAEVNAGALVLVGHHPDESEQVNMAFAPGHWSCVFAAAIHDGHPIAAEHWPGRIDA